MITRVVLFLIFAFGLFPADPIRAQSFPARPIKMIVPFPPGGPVDVTARLVGQHLPRMLGQSVIIENRAGAAGSLGAKAAASAEPDGYTLLCGNISTLVVLPAVTNNRDYDPSKHFIPVAKVSQNYEVLVVHPAFAARSIRELVGYANAEGDGRAESWWLRSEAQASHAHGDEHLFPQVYTAISLPSEKDELIRLVDSLGAAWDSSAHNFREEVKAGA